MTASSAAALSIARWIVRQVDAVPPQVVESVPACETKKKAAAVSVSVAVLGPGPGSAVFGPGATVTVLTRFAVAPALVVTVSVYVAAAPTGGWMVSSRPPSVGPAGHVAPRAASQVQVAAETAASPMTVSVTVAPTAASGPALVTAIVYSIFRPATYFDRASNIVTE